MIAIKDMEMPESCYDCPFAMNKETGDYGSFCMCGILEDYETINLLEHSKHPNCPLIDQESVLDKVKKARERIEKMSKYTSVTGATQYTQVNREDILEIMDELIESEEAWQKKWR